VTVERLPLAGRAVPPSGPSSGFTFAIGSWSSVLLVRGYAMKRLDSDTNQLGRRGVDPPESSAGAIRRQAGKIAYWPVPFKKTVWGLLLASSFTAILAVLLPAALGVNVTVMLQLAPPARLLGQVFVWLKSPGFVPVI
jgi:hypothetical protein